MRYVDQNDQTIPESEVDLENGYVYEQTIIKEDAIPPDDITKFAYDDDDYEVVKVYVRIPTEEKIRKEIQERKTYLNDTDYVVIKIAEGVASTSEYQDVIARRTLAREQINILEEELKDLKGE